LFVHYLKTPLPKITYDNNSVFYEMEIETDRLTRKLNLHESPDSSDTVTLQHIHCAQ